MTPQLFLVPTMTKTKYCSLMEVNVEEILLKLKSLLRVLGINQVAGQSRKGLAKIMRDWL